jgi:acetyl esterase/lipase
LNRLLFLFALLAAACTPRTVSRLDSIDPHPTHTTRVAAGVAYGAEHRQRLDVYRPERAVPGPLPVVVFFYGGGWDSGSRGGYEFAGRAFASRGFVAVVPDYRLSPEVRFPTFVEDAARAVRWARDHAAEFGGDPARIAIAGHSAGAYIGAMLALDPRWLAAAGVGSGTVRAAALMSGPYYSNIVDPRVTRVAAFQGWPEPAATQPFNFATADAPAMWLATGTLDRVVPPRNSEVLAARLRALGVPAEFRQYRGRGHADLVLGLSLNFRAQAPTALDDAAEFLKAHL